MRVAASFLRLPRGGQTRARIVGDVASFAASKRASLPCDGSNTLKHDARRRSWRGMLGTCAKPRISAVISGA